MCVCAVADGMEDINCRLKGEEPGVLLQALHNPHCHLDHIQEENALHYLSLLQAMAAAKAEVCPVCSVCSHTCTQQRTCACTCTSCSFLV